MDYTGKRVRLSPLPGLEFYIIIDMQEHKAVGFCGISKTKELIGLFIEPAARRQGFASETVEILAKHFSIHVTTSIHNMPMQKLMEKLGYSKWLKYER